MPLDAAAIAEVNRQYSGDPFIFLVTLTHPDFAATIRLAWNTEDIVSRSNLYTATKMRMALPGQSENAPATNFVQIDDVDRAVLLEMRSLDLLNGRPQALGELVLASAPDVVQRETGSQFIAEITSDEDSLGASVREEETIRVAFPGVLITPQSVPGSFP